jgi:SanA protein
MVKRILRMLLKIILYLAMTALIVLGLPRLVTEIYSIKRIYTITEIPIKRVAIVFGAGLQRDGTPSPVLQDRVAAAADLFFAGKIEKILMSGDNRFVSYNEPGAMYSFAIKLGVPANAIVLDYAGRRTYDTCYRAKEIFGVTDAVLVTQRFHLPRALFTCNALGLKSIGAIADRREYQVRSEGYWNLRELPANLAAMWDVWIAKPLPVLGDPEPIFPSINTSKSELG